MKGRVFLIGAGPGDPGLLTLRGAELLGQADVVLYDALSNPNLLRLAPGAEQICVGKHGRSRIWSQAEIIDEILRQAGLGKTVARLKGGDPAVFARTAEEVQAVRQAGIPLQIVPGITAALAAGSYAGIPLTDRGLASAVALVTGHEESDKSGTSLDWDALARFPGTLVIYMGVTTADLWTAALLQAGKPPNTPAALIRRCSLPDQQTIRCRLDEVAQHLTPASKFRPPVIVIVGAVAALAEAGDEPAPLPLRGQTILVTRPSDQADALAGPLRDHGATVLVQPAIEIAAPLDWSPVDRAIESLPGFQLVVFCSHNGVEFFLNRLLERGRDMRSLAGAQLAVVGQKTAQSLGQFHLRADIVPPDFRGKSLADQLVPIARDKKVLIVRASRGRDGWADRLAAAGADITQVVAYSHRDVLQADPNILDLVQAGQVDWVTVTSSAIARSIAHLLGPSLRRVKIASLSPVTSATVRELGYEVAAEADPFTIESLMEAICSAAAGCQGH